MSTPKYFVETVSRIEPDPRSGMVKLTFAASHGGAEEDQVTLIIPAGALNAAFQKVGQVMQTSFGQGRGPGPGRQRGPGGPGGQGFPDLTES